MGSQRVGHDWATLLSLFNFQIVPLRKCCWMGNFWDLNLVKIHFGSCNILLGFLGVKGKDSYTYLVKPYVIMRILSNFKKQMMSSMFYFASWSCHLPPLDLNVPKSFTRWFLCSLLVINLGILDDVKYRTFSSIWQNRCTYSTCVCIFIIRNWLIW